MAGDRNIYMGSGSSGNYNESIQGNYIQETSPKIVKASV